MNESTDSFYEIKVGTPSQGSQGQFSESGLSGWCGSGRNDFSKSKSATVTATEGWPSPMTIAVPKETLESEARKKEWQCNRKGADDEPLPRYNIGVAYRTTHTFWPAGLRPLTILWISASLQRTWKNVPIGAETTKIVGIAPIVILHALLRGWFSYILVSVSGIFASFKFYRWLRGTRKGRVAFPHVYLLHLGWPWLTSLMDRNLSLDS